MNSIVVQANCKKTRPAARWSCALGLAALSLAVALLAGCAPSPPAAVGPTGHHSDLAKLVPVPVTDEWKFQILAESQRVVTSQLRFPTTARFDDLVQYEAYYDKTRNVTWIDVYGNVTCTGDAGQVDRNGYSVRWQVPGLARQDSMPQWKLVDLEVLNSPITNSN